MPIKAINKPISNAFYLFLKEKFHHQRRTDPNKIELKTTAAGVPYAFIDFPVTHARLFFNEKQFHVEENHISIFSTYLSENNEDEYHYTATLLDDEGAEYKLRCYFNNKNETTSGVVLKQMTKQAGRAETYLPLTEQVHYVLKMWINAETDKLVQPLSKEQRHTLSQRITLLEQKVQTLLDNYDASIGDVSYLDDLQKEAKRLIAEEKRIINLQPQYQSALLNTLKETLEWRKAEIITHQAAEQKKAATAALAIAETPMATRSASTIKQKSAKKQKNKSTAKTQKSTTRDAMLLEPMMLQADLAALINKIDAINIEQPLVQQAIQLRQYYADTNLCALQADGVTQCQLLSETLKNTVLSKIKTLIIQAIAQEDKSTINALIMHTNLVPIELLKFAIDLNDKDLLENILSAYPYAINRIQLKFDDADGDEMSPLTYAYENRSPLAFGVLLNHGANPFVLWHQNLPLIHHVLCDKSNKDFYPVMMEKIYLRGQKAILTHLIQLIESHIYSNTSLKDKEINALRSQIEEYRANVDLTLHTSHASQARMVHSDATYVSEFDTLIPEHLRRELAQDHEFQLLKSCFISARVDFCNQLSSSQLHKFNLAGKEIMDEALKNFDRIKNLLTVDSLKENLRCQIELLPKVLRIQEIQKIANNPRSLGAAKELDKEYQKLAKDVAFLQKKLNDTVSDPSIGLLHKSLDDLFSGLKQILVSTEITLKSSGTDSVVAAPDLPCSTENGSSDSAKQRLNKTSLADLLSRSMSELFSEDTKPSAATACHDLDSQDKTNATGSTIIKL